MGHMGACFWLWLEIRPTQAMIRHHTYVHTIRYDTVCFGLIGCSFSLGVPGWLPLRGGFLVPWVAWSFGVAECFVLLCVTDCVVVVVQHELAYQTVYIFVLYSV